ncbi:MAG: hypothetical protein KDA22_00040, partial [Phycisphaerales bacterium]|nr:hypothetical protein [Phycisphaerales bacterium]
MPVQAVQAPPEVESCAGRFALQRGPVVYCVEGLDSAGDLRQLFVPRNQTFATERRDDLLGGVTVVEGTAERTIADGGTEAVPFAAIPYATWANRSPSPMLVWLPEDAAHADRPVDPSLRPSASHCWQMDAVDALCDRQGGDELGEGRSPRFTWWPHLGSTEWVQYDFVQPRRVRGVEMEWFDDVANGGGCALPASWRLLRREGDDWTEIVHADVANGETKTLVEFPAVETTALRLECQLAEGRSAGLLEWRVLD